MTGNSQKLAKTKIVNKTPDMWQSPSKGKKRGQESPGSLKTEFNCQILTLCHFLKEKEYQERRFLK